MANKKQPTPVVPEGTDNFNPAAGGPEESEDFAPLSASRGPNPFKGWVVNGKSFRKTVPGVTEPLAANVHVKTVLTGIRRDAREQGLSLRERVTAQGDDTLIQWQGIPKRERKSPEKPAEKPTLSEHAAQTQAQSAKPAAKVAAKR